ncbi:nitrite reductase small subunit NirD [Microbulbifer rhizosphaerae]|uniref:Nitrite reductase (NADH) small subunit n=1 Tax=Microbulbifer rhizosphaerae TaxID=1562603 RepID=A0A7W4W8H1_9GAMM|nr:nitrite reductase small subunit NirD [Microbulbifer rhizosphaerae]MBB3059660.1 nitrite reductase (NADH) small subunit [Microbulbifer rhizosphaerae]
MTQVAITHPQWQPICKRSDLVADSGVCALVGDPSLGNNRSIALFFLPDCEPELYALDNWDPFSKAGVIARGLVAEVDGQLTVASPLYKQHFRLSDGVCLEDESVKLNSYQVAFDGDTVCIAVDL